MPDKVTLLETYMQLKELYRFTNDTLLWAVTILHVRFFPGH